jgi:hypothetical protein
MQTGKFLLANGKAASPKDLVAFTHKTKFVTARKEIGPESHPSIFKKAVACKTGLPILDSTERSS